jgi:hypothetical protein
MLAEAIALTYRQTGTASLSRYVWHWRSGIPHNVAFYSPSVVAGLCLGWTVGIPLAGAAWAVGLTITVAVLRGAVLVWHDERQLASPAGRREATVAYSQKATEMPRFPWPEGTLPDDADLPDPSWAELWVDSPDP